MPVAVSALAFALLPRCLLACMSRCPSHAPATYGLLLSLPWDTYARQTVPCGLVLDCRLVASVHVSMPRARLPCALCLAHLPRHRIRGASSADATREHPLGASPPVNQDPATPMPRTLSYIKLPAGGQEGDAAAEGRVDRTESMEGTREKVEQLLKSASVRLGLDGSDEGRGHGARGRDERLAERAKEASRERARQRSRSRESLGRSRSTSARGEFIQASDGSSERRLKSQLPGDLIKWEEVASASVRSLRVSNEHNGPASRPPCHH